MPKKKKKRKVRAEEHMRMLTGDRRVAASGTGGHRSAKDYRRKPKHKGKADEG